MNADDRKVFLIAVTEPFTTTPAANIRGSVRLRLVGHHGRLDRDHNDHGGRRRDHGVIGDHRGLVGFRELPG